VTFGADDNGEEVNALFSMRDQGGAPTCREGAMTVHRKAIGALRGKAWQNRNDEVNFHIEITVTKGEHAHVFKFECGDKHVTVDGKGLVKMHGNFEHLRKDQVSALGNLVTDFVGDMGLIPLREKRVGSTGWTAGGKGGHR